MSATPEQRLAEIFALILNQTYQLKDGAWWLFTNGEAKRPLREQEIKWHKDRNHAPFIEGGITVDHPDWWKEPA